MPLPVDKSQNEQELAAVLHVGPYRARLLIEAGILSVADLRAIDEIELGRIKGIGLRNGVRIKEWLARQEKEATAAPASAPAASAPVIPRFDPALAAANQTINDDLSLVHQAMSRIQNALPQGGAHRKLDKQVDKLLSVLSDLVEGPDTLRPKQLSRAVKMLRLISSLLDKFADSEKHSDKIMTAFAEELRDRRRRLQKILDPKKK